MRAQLSGACQARSGLIEDFSFTRQPPLAAELDGRFAAVQMDEGGHRNLLLSVDETARSLVLFEPDLQSPSGWRHSTEAVPDAPAALPIQRLLAFRHGPTLHALVHYPNPLDAQGSRTLLLERDGDGPWRRPKQDSTTRNMLESTRQMGCHPDASGNLLVHAVSTNYETPHLVISTYGESGWQHLLDEPIDDPDCGYGIVAGAGVGQLAVVQSRRGEVLLRAATLQQGRWQWRPADDVRLSLQLDIAAIHSLHGPSLAASFLVHARDGRLHLVSGCTGPRPDVLELTGADPAPRQVRAVSTGIDASGRTVVFAIDEGAHLHILRQALTARGVTRRMLRRAAGVFEPWVPLGDTCAAIACPSRMGDAAEVFIAGVDRRVLRLGQGSGNGLWSANVLEVPRESAEPPAPATTYSVQLTALDAAGQVCPNTVVEVRSDSAATLAGNGIASDVDANHPARFVTDALGRVDLAMRAAVLSAPTLRVHVPDQMRTGEEFVVRPDLALHRRLAGLDKDFPVTPAALKQHGVLPKRMKDADATQFAKALRQVGSFLVDQAAAEAQDRMPPGAGRRRHRFVLEIGEQGRFRFRTLSPEQVRVQRRQLLARAPQVMVAAGDGASSRWGDFVNWFCQLGKGLLKIVAEVVKGVLRITVAIAGAVWDFALTTLAAAGKVLEVMFAGLGAVFGVDLLTKAIAWLRSVFDWPTIVRTADTLAEGISGTIDQAARWGQAAAQRVGQTLDDAARNIEQTFDRLEQTLGDASLERLFTGGGRRRVAGPLAQTPYAEAHERHAVASDYLLARMPKDDAALAGLAPRATGANAAASEFFDALAEALPLAKVKQSLRALFAKLAELGRGGHFLQCGLLILLEAVKQIIVLLLQALREIVTRLLRLLADGLLGLKEWLNSPIELPLISAICRLVTGGKPLTPLRLMTLLMAVPMVTLMKAVSGQGPFDRPVRRSRSLAATPHTTRWLPALHYYRTLLWGLQYGFIATLPPDAEFEPAPKRVVALSVLGGLLTLGCVFIERYPFGLAAGEPGARHLRLPGDDASANATMFDTIAGFIGLGYLAYGRFNSTVVAADLAVLCLRGLLELLASIFRAFSSDVEAARKAKSFLTAFPDICLLNALAKDPICGTVGGASYIGATVASAFVEVEFPWS